MKVGLRYLGGAIPKEDIEDFRRLLTEHDIEFKTHDYERRPQASFDEISGVISIFLEASLVSSFIQAIGTNATWDAIKVIVKKVWLTTRGKKYSKITSRGVEEKEVTISVRANLKTDDYFFKIDGLKDSGELDRAMDKILTHLEAQKSKSDKNKIFEVTFDGESKEWISKDFLKEIMEKQKVEKW
ncbi:hypothetical protein JDW21_11520 [Bacillus subtilis]|uniref:hypothetical protein n=1 Tax=Bacillaceae TaxID=186817 RepID=UPI00132EA916|nr:MULTISPECIES: hypothetical protein [Bacillaceae]QHF56573.1 hypothetical protein Bateq7PJ16_0767 [Bacillus subtilis]